MNGKEALGAGFSAGRQTSAKPSKYFLEIAEFILGRYPSAKKIVEIGVGWSPYTALQLKSKLPEAELIVTDVNEQVAKQLLKYGLKAFIDDVSNPRVELYEGADLIYSIRPPFELIPKIIKLGEIVASDVLIAPLSEDAYLSDLDLRLKRIKLKEAIVYLLERSTTP